jgi:hypothetical protein
MPSSMPAHTEKTPSLPPLPKMPSLPPNPRATLPPLAPPPRRASEAPRANASADPDSWLDETEIRNAEAPEDAPTQSLPQLENVDFDSSLPGITEVKSALTFNRRQRTSPEDFDVTTARIDRKELLRQAAHVPVGDDQPTAPTLKTSGSGTPGARATMQVSPDQLERVRRLSEKLENSDAASRAVLELVDSVELSQDDLTDDLDASSSLAVSDPELQAFRNDDWGRESYTNESESGERLLRDQPRPVPIVRFAEEEDPREPLAFSDVSFSDDLSLVPDLTGETNALVPPTMLAAGYPSTEGNTALLAAPAVPGHSPHDSPSTVPPPQRASHAPQGAGGTAALPQMGHAQAQMAYAQQAPHLQTKPSPQMPMMMPEPQPMMPQQGMQGMQQPMISVPTASGGFAPLNPGTKLRQSPLATQPLPAQQTFVPPMTAPRAFPIVNTALPASDAVMGASTGFGFPRAQESGQVSTSADVPSQLRKKERGGWAAPLLFVAVLVGSLAGVFLYLQKSNATPPAAAASASPSATPTASAVAMAPAVPVQTAPVQPQVAAVNVVPGAPPLVAASALPAAKAPAAPAPKAGAPKAPAAPAPKKAAPAKGGPAPAAAPADEGPKQLSPAAPAEAPAAPPALQGLGDLLNGAL